MLHRVTVGLLAEGTIEQFHQAWQRAFVANITTLLEPIPADKYRLQLDVGAGSTADEAPPTTDELSQSLAEMATRSPRGRLAEALRSSPMQPGAGTQERTGPEL